MECYAKSLSSLVLKCIGYHHRLHHNFVLSKYLTFPDDSTEMCFRTSETFHHEDLHNSKRNYKKEDNVAARSKSPRTLEFTSSFLTSDHLLILKSSVKFRSLHRLSVGNSPIAGMDNIPLINPEWIAQPKSFSVWIKTYQTFRLTKYAFSQRIVAA